MRSRLDSPDAPLTRARRRSAGVPLATLVLALAFWSGPAWAQDPTNDRFVEPAPQEVNAPATTGDDRGVFTLSVENDIFGGTDRYFTNGLQLGWRSPSANPPGWLSWFGRAAAPFFPVGGATRWGVALGHNIYTPEDTQTRTPDPDDRPYAAWLYGALSLSSHTDTTLGLFELQLGVVGPSALGEEVQNNFHDLIEDRSAKGWDKQIEDEPGVNLLIERKWRYNATIDGDPRGFGIGVVPTIGASLGNVQTYGGVGVMGRVGWNLAADFGPPRIRPAFAGTQFFEPGDSWGGYLFASVDGRAVARDIFLDGNTTRDSRSVEKEPLVGDLAIGAVAILGGTRIAYVHTFRTKEFEGQRQGAQWGSVSLSLRF